MEIHALPSGHIATNAYLLTNASRGEAMLIDAPEGVFEQVNEIVAEKKCRLVALLITHAHWDHIGDAARIQAAGVPLSLHEADRRFLEQPQIQAPFAIPGVRLEPARIDRVLADGEKLELLGHTFEVRHVPGHCPGNVLFHLVAGGIAFVGDALFRGAYGRTDLPGANHRQLQQSVRDKIFTLPDATTLAPGHGPTTTVADEKRGNPLFAFEP